MNGPFNRQFRPVQTEADWLSRDPEAVNAYLADPKCGFVFTASAYYDLFSVMKRVQTAKWGRALDPELPYLVISGTEDPVGGNGKGVEKVVRRMRRGGAADVTLHLYEGARHELLNETKRLCRISCNGCSGLFLNPPKNNLSELRQYGILPAGFQWKGVCKR